MAAAELQRSPPGAKLPLRATVAVGPGRRGAGLRQRSGRATFNAMGGLIGHRGDDHVWPRSTPLLDVARVLLAAASATPAIVVVANLMRDGVLRWRRHHG
jgi:hypothetical protein